MPWAAVIGAPIAHSLSPALHRAAWTSIGLGGEWRYERLETRAEDLPALLSSLDGECVGLSATMPCKQAIIPLLDAVDPLAAAVGAVNTLVPSAGVLSGFNTDVHGIVAAIGGARAEAGLPEPSSALVLGAGATAASSLAALGTLGVVAPSVAARRFGGPGSIVAAASRLGVDLVQIPWSDEEAVVRAVSEADVVISTLPEGVADALAARLHPREDQTLLDVVYSPRRTGLVGAWRDAGALVADGLDMLVHQAALQVRLMTGADPSLDAMREAVAQWY